jgi:hypothetical protein
LWQSAQPERSPNQTSNQKTQPTAQSLRSSCAKQCFSTTSNQKNSKTTKTQPQHDRLGKLKYNLKTLSLQGFGELGVHPAERTAEVAVDPLNLNQIILAEGKKI